jgi:hypothetical protein
MIEAERLFSLRQRALKKRPCLREVALGMERGSEQIKATGFDPIGTLPVWPEHWAMRIDPF